LKKKHLHRLGLYWHSSSELSMFAEERDLDGLGEIYELFKFCPDCGARLTKPVIRKQMGWEA